MTLLDELTLGNGDTVSERLQKIDFADVDGCSTDEMREQLGL